MTTARNMWVAIMTFNVAVAAARASKSTREDNNCAETVGPSRADCITSGEDSEGEAIPKRGQGYQGSDPEIKTFNNGRHKEFHDGKWTVQPRQMASEVQAARSNWIGKTNVSTTHGGGSR